MQVPLSSANRRFILHRVIDLHTRIFNDKFVQYSLDFPYLGIDSIQRNYILLTETDSKIFTESCVTMCPANRAVFSTRVINCESSLFFQMPDSLCARRGYFYATRRQLYYVTIPYGSSIFQLTNKFFYNV